MGLSLLLSVTALLLMTTPPAAAQILQVQYTDHFSVRPANAQIAYSPTTARDECVSRGGALIADHSNVVTQAIIDLCAQSGLGPLCTSFLDGSAAPDALNRLQCVERTPLDQSGPPNSRNCFYRWREGFFDSLAFVVPDVAPGYFQSGTVYYRYLYLFAAGQVQTWNGYTYSPWNTSTALHRDGYPHGYFQTMGAVDGNVQTYARMDTPVPAQENNPNPLSSFYVACAVQGLPLPISTSSSRAPQPPVVLGKGPWPQEYWWVIFLIVAVVVLILLFVVLYCCTKCIKERRARSRSAENPVENSVILREREGSGYINEDDDDDDNSFADDDNENKSRGLPVQQPTYGSGVFPMGMMYPMDPTDLLQGQPLVFSQSDRAITADGDAFSESEFREADSDEEAPDDGDESRRVVRRVRSTRSMDSMASASTEAASSEVGSEAGSEAGSENTSIG